MSNGKIITNIEYKYNEKVYYIKIKELKENAEKNEKTNNLLKYFAKQKKQRIFILKLKINILFIITVDMKILRLFLTKNK